MSPRDDSAPKLEVTESIPLKVGNWLLCHRTDYAIWPGSQNGQPEFDWETERFATFSEQQLNSPVGLLYKGVRRVPKQFGPFKWIKTVYVHDFIGILSVAGTKKWSLKVYGRQYMELCCQLALHLQMDFAVSVAIKLVEEKPRYWEEEKSVSIP